MKNFKIQEQDMKIIESIGTKYNVATDELARNLIRTTSNRRESNRIQIRLSEEEKSIIEKKSDDLKIGASTYCRMVAINARVSVSLNKLKELYEEEIKMSKGGGADNRDSKLNIRFKTNSEIDIIEERAAELSLDASEYIRFVTLNSNVSVESSIDK